MPTMVAQPIFILILFTVFKGLTFSLKIIHFIKLSDFYKLFRQNY